MREDIIRIVYNKGSKMETKMTKEQFIDRVRALQSVKSVKGVTYSRLTVVGHICTGIRESTGQWFEISLDKLYAAYVDIDEKELNTSTLKKYVDRRQSPGLAILKAII